jgi:very-short-patch-repair endonuclease
MHDKNINYLKKYRRELRKKMTPAEVALWQMLRNRQLDGIRFVRQYSLNNYIMDFYCPQFHLAIELYGDVHFDEFHIEKDKVRAQFLENKGIRILRFENFEVFQYPERTLNEIRRYLHNDEKPENLLVV